MRKTFVQTLTEAVAKDKNIFLLTGDLGFGVFEDFARTYPRQYMNMGVSESNMMGVAAGMALSGKIVYAYSIIPFATMRPFEQIRNDICMQCANVRIVGVGAGLAYGELGPTHHSIQDVAIMRTLPNMTVLVPGDPIEVRHAVGASFAHQGPMYIRLAKRGEPIVHTKEIDFKIGKAIPVQDGKDLTLIVSGHLLPQVVAVAGMLGERGISTRVISMPTIKPLDIEVIQKASRETKAICAIEEHSVIGGLGSAVAEVLAEANSGVRFRRFGVQDIDTKIVGSHAYLQKLHRLGTDELYEDILKFYTTIV